MDVRLLDIEDAYQFRDLRMKGLRTNPTAFGSTYEYEMNLPKEKFEERLACSAARFTVGGFDNGQLVCMASFVRETGDKFKHKGMLIAMYCEKDYRGTGMAKKVVTLLINHAKTLEGLKMIKLTVVSENLRAKHFYQYFGFEKYGTEPRALFDGERYDDEDLMFLDIQ